MKFSSSGNINKLQIKVRAGKGEKSRTTHFISSDAVKKFKEYFKNSDLSSDDYAF